MAPLKSAGASVLVMAALTALPHPSSAQSLKQDAGTIEARLRVLAVIPESSSSSITPIGGSVDASTSFVPELDGTYFFTPNWAAELIAAVTQHEAHARGTALGDIDVGSAWLLPPTLTLQYHCQPIPAVDIYAGAGINYTFFLGINAPQGMSVHYQNNVGAAIQAGLDYALTDRWVLNVDVKQIFLNTTATVNGVVKAHVALNPTLVGIGVGYRF